MSVSGAAEPASIHDPSRTADSAPSRSPLSKTRLVLGLDPRIVQRATVAVLNAIYEEDLLGFSYGLRPGRGAHDALDALAVGITSKKVLNLLKRATRQ